MSDTQTADRPRQATPVSTDPRRLYLDLVKKSLMCTLYEELDGAVWQPAGGIWPKLVRALIPSNVDLVLKTDLQLRSAGHDWPRLALTMIGSQRLDNLQQCIEKVLEEGITGDFIETGVWRGGSCIFMRAMLAAHAVTDRRVFVADSFRGVPRPDAANYPADAGETFHVNSCLAVSEDRVRANFDRFGLLDDQVQFLVGWFKDTLPVAPIRTLAMARLDGDLYESTMDALVNLYPKLSPGGFLIVDDYGCVAGCRQAVDDFRRTHGIVEPLQPIDWTGVFWRRNRG